MRLLVKIGGAQLRDQDGRIELASSVAHAKHEHEIVLVHGGGDQIRTLTGRLGIEDRYHEGLRITDAATAEAVLMVLGGQVNRQLVQALGSCATPAVGLTGADGQTFFARKLTPDGVDIGFVGCVDEIYPQYVLGLMRHGPIPVIATVAPLRVHEHGEEGRFYNINADHAAGDLACAFEVDAVLFLTDVPGVLDAEGNRIAKLTPGQCYDLKAEGVIHGGMIPKVDAALMALAEIPNGRVVIAPGTGSDAIRNALSADVGTTFRN